MKRDAIAEAEHILSSGSEFEGPRKIYQLELALAMFEALAAIICASFCCRACCCVPGPLDRKYEERPHHHNGAPAQAEKEELGDWASKEQGDLGRKEYNEYRK